MRLFGVLVLLFLILWTASIIFIAASVPEAASRAGRSIVWIAIGTSIAWRWIRLVWTPFEQWTLENDNPDLIKARGPIDAFRLWFTQLRKWLNIEKPELRPYQYSNQPTPKSRNRPPLAIR